MQRRNALTLVMVLIAVAVWMTVIHLILFPRQGILGISGIGLTAVALMFFNRYWLAPGAPALPRPIILRSLMVAAILGTSFVLLFGAIGM